MMDQAPLYIQELLAWEFWSSSIYAGVFLVATIVVFFVLKKLFKVVGNDDLVVPVIIVSVIAAVLLPFGFITSVRDAVKVKVAPRVVLVEKIQSVLKK